MKKLLRLWLFRILGSSSFIRRIEWIHIFRWLNAEKGNKILDVACGNGCMTLKLAEKGCQIYGIDISIDAIQQANNLAEITRTTCEFQVADAQQLPYPSNIFDKVVSSSSLEHITNDALALNEVLRVLKPGGIAVITTDSLTFPISKEYIERHKEVAYVVKYYTEQSLIDIFERAGFKVADSKYILNSHLTSFFYKIGIVLKFSGIRWLLVSLIAYPVCLLAERWFGVNGVGYTLIIKGLKNST